MGTVTSLWNWLRGKKTYIAGAAAILAAVAKALGDNDWSAAWHTIEPALMAMAIRHGISGN